MGAGWPTSPWWATPAISSAIVVLGAAVAGPAWTDRDLPGPAAGRCVTGSTLVARGLRLTADVEMAAMPAAMA